MIRLRLAPVLLGGLLWLTAAAASTLADYKFDSPVQERQFRELTEELRCLVCQNESLAGSQAELAQDLRREVYQMMRAGKSRDEIVNFLVARYGDFVLYSPPLKPSTYVLWFGPLLLMVAGAVLLWRVLRDKQGPAQDDLSPAEQQRLQALFDADRPPGNP